MSSTNSTNSTVTITIPTGVEGIRVMMRRINAFLTLAGFAPRSDAREALAMLEESLASYSDSTAPVVGKVLTEEKAPPVMPATAPVVSDTRSVDLLIARIREAGGMSKSAILKAGFTDADISGAVETGLVRHNGKRGRGALLVITDAPVAPVAPAPVAPAQVAPAQVAPAQVAADDATDGWDAPAQVAPAQVAAQVAAPAIPPVKERLTNAASSALIEELRKRLIGSKMEPMTKGKGTAALDLIARLLS